MLPAPPGSSELMGGSCDRFARTHLIRIAASGLDASRVPGLDIGFQGGHGPAVGLAPRAEMPCQQMGLILADTDVTAGGRRTVPGSRPQPRRAGP